MKYKKITDLIRGENTGGTGYPANRRREVRIKAVKKPSTRMKQFGDKGYKPSTGKGVGY